MLIRLFIFCVASTLAWTLSGCQQDPERLKIGVSFETLQTEYWVASFEAVRADLERRGIEMIEAIADNDPNRQLEQVETFIARGVDGILVSPHDGTTVIPMIQAANRAGIPIVIYNRPPAPHEGTSVTVVADNYMLTKATVKTLAEKARALGGKYQAMILIGHLADMNAIGRRDGFFDAVAEYPDLIEVVARVPTEWNQEVALAGVTNALHAHPDINLIFTSSDFLFPSLMSALQGAGRWHPIGHPDHVLLAGFDGDSLAYQLLQEGYLDADGVQDVYFECRAAVDALLRMRAGEQLDPVIQDPGFVIEPGNLKEKASEMWGARTSGEVP